MEDYAAFRHLRVMLDDGVAVVGFDSQDDGPLERSFFTDLRDVFSPLGYDADIRAVVLTGQGDVFFTGVGRERSARLMQEGSIETITTQFGALQGIVAAILGFRKPLVAAVNGAAPNIGGNIALLCDAAVASEAATFGDHHVPGGIAAGDGGTVVWPLLVGMARAREILLLGRPLDAREALDLHLVAEVVEPERCVPAAVALARQLSEIEPLAYTATKLALNNWWRFSGIVSWDQALAYEAAALKLRTLGG
jgi:enoyl-CoA hydratase